MGSSISSTISTQKPPPPAASSTTLTSNLRDPPTIPFERNYITKSYCLDVLSQASYALGVVAHQVRHNTEVHDYHKAIEARFEARFKHLEAQNSILQARCRYLETRQSAIEARSASLSRLEALPTELLHYIYLQYLDAEGKLVWKLTSRTLYHNTLRPNGKELITLDELKESSTEEEWDEYRTRMFVLEFKTPMEIDMLKLTCSYCLQSLPRSEPHEDEDMGFSDEHFDRSNLVRACVKCVRRLGLAREYQVRGHRRFVCLHCYPVMSSLDEFEEEDWEAEEHTEYTEERLEKLWKDCVAHDEDTDWCPKPLNICDMHLQFIEDSIEWREAQRVEAGEEPRIPIHSDDAKGCRDIRTYFGAK